MPQLVMVTTGIDANMGAVRTEAVTRFLTNRGGHIRSAGLVRQGPNPDRMPVLNELVMLALWGLHHAGTPISRRSLQGRISYSHQIISRQLAKLISNEVGWIETASRDDSQPGRPIVTYRLTTKGQTQVRLWFSRIFQGTRIAAEFATPSRLRAATQQLLDREDLMRGLILPSQSGHPVPVPYDVSTLVLMVSWVLEQAGTAANAPDIADRLLCYTSSVHGAFQSLVQAELLRESGSSPRRPIPGYPASRFKLTENGHELGRQYAATVLT